MIIFTLCSNNYLAQAKTLGDSIIAYNPGYKFVIGLVDEYNQQVDYSFYAPFTIIPVAEIGIPDFDELWKKYSIVEFNTSVKASFFKYLFKANTEVGKVCYFDPDIVIYHSLKIIEESLTGDDIILTPHIVSPIQADGKQPGENIFLKYGLYNLGFLGLNRNCLKNGFLDWWEERILSTGFHNTLNGFFVDQLWINLVPLFFDRVKIMKDLGLNVAPWNLHERIIDNDNVFGINSNERSLFYFYHFSSFLYNEPEKMSKYYDRFTFETNPELVPLYMDYRQRLIKNKIESLSAIPCSYIEKQQEYLNAEKIASGKKTLRSNVFKTIFNRINT